MISYPAYAYRFSYESTIGITESQNLAVSVIGSTIVDLFVFMPTELEDAGNVWNYVRTRPGFLAVSSFDSVKQEMACGCDDRLKVIFNFPVSAS